MKNLKTIRTESKMTQNYLGELVGVSGYQIYRYETNRSIPPLEIAISLANVFNTTIDFIVDRTDNRNRPGDTPTMINNLPVVTKEKRIITYYRDMNKKAQSEFEIIAERMPKKKGR